MIPALGAGVFAVGFGAFGASSGASSPPPLGIYLGYENTSGVDSLGNAMGQQPSFAMDYLDGSSWSTMESSAANEAAKWSSSGYSMTFSIPMLPNSGATLAGGAAGDYNAYFETMAQNLVANNEGSSIVRPGWEFNGNWYPWAANSSNVSQFIGFWQQLVTAMRSVSGANFKFEWCPTLGDQGIGNLANYYPGNSYVDDVAADVYDQTWSNYPGASGEFSDLETESYGLNWLTSFASQQGKAVVLGEWGLGSGSGNAGQAYSANNQQVSGGDDPTFINDMAQWLMTNHVYEASYFDDQSMALSPKQNPNSYNVFRQGLRSGRCGQRLLRLGPDLDRATTHHHDNGARAAAHDDHDDHHRRRAHHHDDHSATCVDDDHDRAAYVVAFAFAFDDPDHNAAGADHPAGDHHHHHHDDPQQRRRRHRARRARVGSA